MRRGGPGEPLAPPRPITANDRAFRVMVRNAMFQRVQLAARDRFEELAGWTPPRPRSSTAAAGRPAGGDWEEALGALLGRARGARRRPRRALPRAAADQPPPAGATGREWLVRQIIDDPEGNHDWAIVATVDLDASDAAGEPVVRTRSFGPAA